jgi:hypothetical protein
MEGTSAGIDWASEEHALCVVDAAGGELSAGLFGHEEAGIRQLVARMRGLEVERVAIERPDGLLVDRFSAPEGRAEALESEARRGAVLGLVTALKPIVAQIAGALRAHPDSQVFLPLFRDPKSTITAARLVAEIGDDRSRYARESGKRKVASFRWACEKRLREAVACLADLTRHHHPWARSVYLRARSRGLDHPHAIRVLGRAWLRVLWRCWQDEVAYDPAKHGNLRRLQPAGG